MPGRSSVAAQWPVGSAVGSWSATEAPIVATSGAADVVDRRRERLVGVATDADDLQRRVRPGGVADRPERAGEAAAAVVEGVVVGHGRHVDPGSGERGERRWSRGEGEALARLGPPTRADRGLEVGDREVRGRQGVGRGRERGGGVAQAVGQDALEVDVADQRDPDRAGVLVRSRGLDGGGRLRRGGGRGTGRGGGAVVGRGRGRLRCGACGQRREHDAGDGGTRTAYASEPRTRHGAIVPPRARFTPASGWTLTGRVATLGA